MLIRILVKQNTTADLNIIHGYQNTYNLTATPRTLTQPNSLQAPQLTLSFLNNGTLAGSPALQILQLLAKIAPFNQPEILTERYRVASILGQAGLVNGQYYPPAGVNLTQAYAIANATITDIVTDPANINYVGNGWQLSITPFEGNFGTNYAPRTYIAQTGYQQVSILPQFQLNSADQALARSLHHPLPRLGRPLLPLLHPRPQHLLPLHLLRQATRWTPRFLELDHLRRRPVPHQQHAEPL